MISSIDARKLWVIEFRIKCTVCPRSSDPFCIVTYYIIWVTTSWTYSTNISPSLAVNIIIPKGKGKCILKVSRDEVKYSYDFIFNVVDFELIFIKLIKLSKY